MQRTIKEFKEKRSRRAQRILRGVAARRKKEGRRLKKEDCDERVVDYLEFLPRRPVAYDEGSGSSS